ncbi:DMT family transporter [Microbacterium sp. CIAB417]|uniref:DMT family transporter n=1 Tax=Microbacterium sp. CIAB417 TaxID=2860287 RepID=UPI001FAE6B15|nr:DMT family transporter [Microbacterium sp. CIAB417]
MPDTRRLPAFAAVGGAVSIGAMTAVQARINGVLGVRLDDGILAGLVSFLSGTVLLAVIVLVLPSGRSGMRRLWRNVRSRDIPPWMLLGGACGALTVTTQGLTAAVLGVSLFTVGVVAGQTVHGLILDRIGFGPAGVVAVTMGRVAGGALALVAVGISLGGDVLEDAPLWMLILPFAAGVGIAWQQATNGRLAQRVGSPMIATMTSFIAGTIVLAVAAGISVLVQGPPEPLPAEPWLYLGGALGVVYIFLGAFLVAQTGVLLLGLGSVLGQLVTAVLIDAIWPADSAPAIWQIIAMVTVAVTGVLVALIRPRRR